jgi:hypothetical protein
MIAMYTSDSRTGIIVMKNNIMYVTNGANIMRSGQWTSGQLVHTNNIFTLSGGSLNFTLDGTERSTAIQYWTNTTSSNPLNWDFNLLSTSYAINNGVTIAGLTRDFIGNTLGTPPDIGILEYASAVPPTACTFTYGTWTSCTSGLQTRTYTASPIGCLGTPPLDSIQTNCTNACTSFTYDSWSSCSNYIQTRSYTAFPSGCNTIPPTDSVQKICYCTSYTYSGWSTCVNGVQTRTYTATPIGCLANPEALTRSCTVVSLKLTLVSATRGVITVSASGGTAPSPHLQSMLFRRRSCRH